MRISTAYFAGVGTVVVAVGVGLGGGYLAANIANPPSVVSKLERRMSAEPISVAAVPSQPAPRAVVTGPASAPAQEAAPAGNAAPPTNNIRVEEKPANNVAAVPPLQGQPQPAKPTEQKSVEQTVEKAAPPRDAFARARDADVKRADAEKRRAERRQLWAERRRVQQPREQDLEAVEARVREVTEPRRIRVREEGEPDEMFAERARADMPRIRLFDLDN